MMADENGLEIAPVSTVGALNRSLKILDGCDPPFIPISILFGDGSLTGGPVPVVFVIY